MRIEPPTLIETVRVLEGNLRELLGHVKENYGIPSVVRPEKWDDSQVGFGFLVAHHCCDPCRATQCGAHSATANYQKTREGCGCPEFPVQTTRDTPGRWQCYTPPPPFPRAKISATGGSGMGCDRTLWGVCSCDAPAIHSKLRKEPRRGCSYSSVCAT